jgi:molecular chaperone DnaJ
VLRDGDRRRRYDHGAGHVGSPGPRTNQRCGGGGAASDQELLLWLQQVYGPIDRLLGQVINPLAAELRALSADPYDDELMEAFCGFLEQSRARLDKVESLYRSLPCPAAARGFGLSLYHCLSQVQDGVAELERYTMGYVDSYLHDGREMFREAKGRRSRLQQERRRLEI